MAVVYATQVILTIGGAIKFIPSTGVTLPLVSYGGSSLLASLLMFGIVQTKGTVVSMEGAEGNKRTAYSVVEYIFIAIFAAMILYFLYFMIFESPIYIYSEYNNLLR